MRAAASVPVRRAVARELAWLRRRGSARNREGMARYAITAERIFGVSVATVRARAEGLGVDHDLALALWTTGWHEARLLAAFVDDPARVTARQMDAWARDFDNWALCDTVCFHLFDRTAAAWGRVAAWATRRDEFVKRAAFALLAGLALHRRDADDARFVAALPLIEAAADDDRNFVRKGVSWALRAIGHRSASLHAEAVAVATRLSAREARAARWIGRDALRDLSSPAAQRRLAGQRRAALSVSGARQ